MAKKQSAIAGKKTGRIRQKTAAFDAAQPITFIDFAGMVSIFCAALLAYFPSIYGTLLWDDSNYITAPALQSVQGLWRIWTELGATHHYFPLLHSAFWIEHLLWGDSVLGYHFINVLFHSFSAILVVLILRQLRLRGSWLAGFIFLLHPVCVQSVAWISGQAVTLAAFLCLVAGLIYLRFDQNRRKSYFLWAAGFFAAALLCNPIVAAFPAALFVLLWWRNGKIEVKRDLASLSPFLGLGIAAVVLSFLIEKAYPGIRNPEFSYSFMQHLLFGCRATWFYFAKLVLPFNLTFIYPQFTVDAGNWQQYLYPAGLIIITGCLLLMGRRYRGLLAGWLLFIAILLPALGLLNFSQFPYSQVADHFQYLAALGIIVPVSSGIWLAAAKLQQSGNFFKSGLRHKKLILTAGIFGLLPVLYLVGTRRQSGTYPDIETLWKTTIARNPGSWIAYNNLGEVLFQQERVDEALPYSRTAVNLKPDNAEANANLGNILRYKQQPGEALVYYRKAADLQPDIASFHGSIANTLLEMGKIKEAVSRYETALKLDPSNGLLANNLAWILATCPTDSLRNGPKALELAQRAVQAIGDQDPTVLGTLAAAYAETGNFKQAVANEERAYGLIQSSGDAESTAWHSQLLESYRAGEPYRESSLNPK